MTTSRFVDDEPGYASWLRHPPSGFVLNCNREPKANYLALHRAECWTILRSPNQGRDVDHAIRQSLPGFDRGASGVGPGDDRGESHSVQCMRTPLI